MSQRTASPDPKQGQPPLTALWNSQKSAALDEYMRTGGYGIAMDTARRGGREVIHILREASLRSLDGAGNPVFMGWRSCQSAPADYKYVICVADDPDPDFPIYRELLTKSPHLVIEGMICGALAVGAHEAFLYLRQDDESTAAALNEALQEAHSHGFLGEDALLDLHLLTGERSFFVWEAGHQLSYLEELIQKEATMARGYGKGLFGWPSIIQNPETWAQVPLVLGKGADWYRSLGRGLAGTKLINLKGPLKKTGLVEVPLGTPLLEIISQYGGGLEDGTLLKAVQLGGSSGGYLPEALLDTPLDFEELAEAGVSMGSGNLEVLDDTVCMVARTLELAHQSLEAFTQEEPEAGRLLNRAKRLLGEIEEARGSRSHLGSLEKTGMELLARTAEGSERSVARPLLTALAYFQFDFTHHIEQGVCATGVRRGLENAPCQAACPAGIDIPTYLALIAEGRYREAIEVIRLDNPLPCVCGIICTHPCEMVCTRAEMDQAISIMALKGYAAERIMADGGYPRPEMEPARPEKVGVEGSGPGGLSAAYYLAKKGYQVTIFEALPVAGGVLSVGIPEYRLPISVVQKEIDAILDLGVELRTGVRVGRDISIQDLRDEGYKAFFLGVGAHEGLKLRLQGELEFNPVMDVMSFLRQVRMGRKKSLAEEVIVVGGGNAAIDAARTSIRLGSSRVTIAYRRTRKEMPAWEEEIVQAEEEGVEIHYLTIPMRVVGENNRVGGLECLKAELGEPDASGRRRPVPIPDSEHVLKGQAILVAIGQRPDVPCITEKEELSVSTRALLVVDPHTLQTNIPDIFAGGDVVTGPATVVQAIGAGKWAAESISAYLQGLALPQGPPPKTARMRLDPVERSDKEGIALKRAEMPLIPLEERRSTFKRVEMGLSEEAAQAEGTRCLRCDLCVGCGLCQAVCEEMGVRSLQLTATSEGRLALTDYHRPARSCIGCGSCVQVCPHQNIRMHDTGEERRIVFCGTQTASLKLEACEGCGEVLAPQAYLSYLRRLVESHPEGVASHKLCPTCARKYWAEGSIGDAIWFPPNSSH